MKRKKSVTFSDLARLGGIARARKLSKARLSAIGRDAVRKRKWRRVNQPKEQP